MRRSMVAALAAFALVPAGAVPAPATVASDGDRPARYTNPISADFADTFADPVIVRGHDGLWYAYGTTDPLREGEGTFHTIPMARSDDLVRWTYVGDAFTAGNRPAYAAPDAGLWAPDVRYLDGRWVMYFTVTDTPASGDDSAIGAATAPTPTGPWTPTAAPVVAPRPAPDGNWLWTFDPAQFTDVDGRRYLYFGSYFGGVWVTELSADGLRATGEATMVAIDNKFEGSHVVRRGGSYYLFASSANCCAGPATGYSVSVGRATNPRGPFVDRDGQRLDVSRAGGTPVVAPNGNRWIGTGHNGLVTDLSGQDWLVYHAIDRADPYLDEPFGINERPMLLDRLDWIGGWPTVRAGAWASERSVRAPVTTAPVFDRFDGAELSRRWRVADGSWAVADGVLRGSGTVLAREGVRGDVRAEADLRSVAEPTGAGLVLGRTVVRVEADALVVAQGRRVLASTPLPASVDTSDWHNLAVEVRAGRLRAELSEARLGDQLATVSARVGRVDGVGVTARGDAEVDNVSAAPLYRPVRRAVPQPRAGRVLPEFSDEFTGDALDPRWTVVRPDAAEVRVSGGTLRWPLTGTDLVGTGAANTAGVLLLDPPAGNYIAETKLTLDLGENTVRNFQQAGLIAYVDDDRFARLSSVAIWNTRQVEYGYELPFADSTAFGGTIVGTPAPTVWLRLAHSRDRAGEHEFRAGVSRDGHSWTWGGVWTFPAGTTPRIGLVTHGGAEPPAVAQFDYLRFHRR